jgi:hypothetical protein
MSAGRDDLACDGNAIPGGKGSCHVLTLSPFPSDATTIIASWLHPQGNRGSLPGLMVSSGAVRIRFAAHGGRGGEKVVFRAGGSVAIFADGFSVSSTERVLSLDWQSYSLDLRGQSYGDGIIDALELAIDLSHNVAPLAIYVSDIVVE